MRLAGYLNALKENSFAIPVYTDKIHYYFHAVNENYKITEFYKADISLNQINGCYISDDFKINDFAAIVFVGKNNYINSNQLNKGIEEVKKYLEETTLEKECLNVKEDVEYFINCLVTEANQASIAYEDIIHQRSVYRNSLIGENKLLDLNATVYITDYLLEESFSKFLSESNGLPKLLMENHELHINFISYVMDKESNLNLKNAILAKLNSIIFLTEKKRSLKKFNHRFSKTDSFVSKAPSSLPVVGATVYRVEGMTVIPMDMTVLPTGVSPFPGIYYYGGLTDEVQNQSKKVLTKKK